MSSELDKALEEIQKELWAAEVSKITQKDVLNALGGLPEESIHCALLAANTLKGAIKDYLAYKNEPWRRAYRKK